jgi:hypothetical protein
MENNSFSFRSCLTLFVIIGVILAGLTIYFNNSNDCVRSKIDGTVRCKCDMPSVQAWDDYLENTKGGYESVVVEGKKCD